MILHSAQHPTSSQLPRANDDVFLTGNKGKRNEKSDLSSWINRFLAGSSMTRSIFPSIQTTLSFLTMT